MNISKSASFLILYLISFVGFSQLGTIRGVIIDDQTGETLIGVNVVLKGTTTGSSTDLDGSFSIRAEAGTYDVIASYISYSPLTITKVVVKADEVTNVGEVRLKVNAITTETVVITATQSRNNESAMATLQKKSANVMDGISSQTFKKAGDSDAGAAIKRVTGVSVEGGKYVYVRGLGDRYTKTTLNGMEIPGLDPDRNSMQLDLFPTNLIDNISVFKSFSPELAGDFTGGAVDIITKDFPDDKQSSLSISLGYNPSMNLNPNFLSYESSDADYVALGANSRETPISRDVELFSNSDPALLTSTTKAFDPTMSTIKQNSFLNTGVGISTGDQLNKEDITYGYNLAASYNRSFKFYEDILYAEYVTQVDNSKNELVLNRRDSGEVGIEEIFWSAFASGSVKKKNSSLSLGLMRLQNGTKQASILDGSKTGIFDQSGILQKHILYYNERSITNLLLSAKHYIPSKDIEVTFKSAPTLAQNKEPDFRQTIYLIEDNEISITGGNGGLSNRIFRELEEWSLSNRLDAKWNFKQWNDQKTTLKGGIAYTYKQRDFTTLTYRANVRSGRRVDYTLNPDEIFKEENIYNVSTNPSGIFLTSSFQPKNNYEANSTNLAVYLQNELPINSTLKAVYGARLESFVINYTGQSVNGEVFNDEEVLNELNILPSLGLVYNLQEEVNLRFNFSQTVARPSFKEKSGATLVDALTGRTFIGNIDVRQTEINNLDLRLEKFYSGGQLISFSAFYKQFSDPIELVAYAENATDQFTPRNSKEALVYGGEFDLKRNLSFLKENWNEWSVGANFTYVVSKIDRRKIVNNGISEYDERVKNARDGEKIDEFRTMQGQSPYVVNTYVNYKNDSLGFELNLSYNVQGKRLAVVGIGRTPNVYEQPFHSLNLKASKALGQKDRSNVSLGVDNILDDQRESLFEAFQAKDQVYSRFSPGRTISVGYSYKF